MSDVFIRAAKKLGLEGVPGHQSKGDWIRRISENGILGPLWLGNPDVRKLLMLAVLEKMGWGIDYYPKTAAPGWWFGSLEFEAQGPFAFSDLPEAVCKAFVEAEE